MGKCGARGYAKDLLQLDPSPASIGTGVSRAARRTGDDDKRTSARFRRHGIALIGSCDGTNKRMPARSEGATRTNARRHSQMRWFHAVGRRLWFRLGTTRGQFHPLAQVPPRHCSKSHPSTLGPCFMPRALARTVCMVAKAPDARTPYVQRHAHGSPRYICHEFSSLLVVVRLIHHNATFDKDRLE